MVNQRRNLQGQYMLNKCKRKYQVLWFLMQVYLYIRLFIINGNGYFSKNALGEFSKIMSLCGHILRLPSVTYRYLIQVRNILFTVPSETKNLSPRSMTDKSILNFISISRYSSSTDSL